MRILLAASEAVPYAKIGGLGDVTGALPGVLTRMGHEVRLILPKYRMIDVDKHDLRPSLLSLGVPTGTGTMWCSVWEHAHPAGFTTYFIEYDDYFDRAGIYGYEDDGSRFLFFCHAVLAHCHATNFSPHVLHCHDWPTAVIPGLLKHRYGPDPLLGYTGSVLTVHNAAHHGKFNGGLWPFTGLPPEAFQERQFEDFGAINLLKGGIANADLINAVSPTYAREILGPVGGAGLDRYFGYRHGDLHGILNGVDYDLWNPESDALIPANYSVDALDGKRVCKEVLQREFGLHVDDPTPIIGVVARLVGQKGLDLLPGCIDAIVGAGAQLVVLGSGEHELEQLFRMLPSHYPGRIGTRIAYDNRLAHLIEAGSDFFLMPSRFEPCGLNQIYSLRYGTLPIVRATGGLDDTVIDYDPETGEGTGFKFHEISSVDLFRGVATALDTYRQRPDHLQMMIRQAMEQRFTWERSAEGYLQLYAWAVAKREHWR